MPNVFSWFLTPPLRGERDEWLVLTAWKRSDVALKCHSFDNLMCLYVSIWPKEFVLTVVVGIWTHWLSKETVCTFVYWHVEVSRLPIAAMAYTSKVPVPAIASPNKRVKSAEAAVFVCVFCVKSSSLDAKTPQFPRWEVGARACRLVAWRSGL